MSNIRRLARRFSLLIAGISTALLAAAGPALAQQRLLGLDVSAWQGNLSNATWATFKRPTDQQLNGVFGDGRDFVFIRSSRGGTTGYYNQSDPTNANGQNVLSQRYDDPYFVQNISRATSNGMFAGAYHFGRMDIIASTPTSNGIPNNGTDEANHFIQMAGPWMRPGYLLPVFDFEAGSGARTAEQLAQFAIDFSNRVNEVMFYQSPNVRPAVYIGNNYANPSNSIPSAAALVAAYPTLWTARWPTDPDLQNDHPGDFTSTVYGPWDNSPNPPDPWAFWQYTSTGGLNGYSGNLDKDVVQGGMEFLKDYLVPALWKTNSSGEWTTLTNWNSGDTPVAPVQGPGQVARVGTMVLPTPRLPGVDDAVTGVDGQNDTVIIDRGAANPTITLSSGTHNIRKLYVGETLNITGGSLTTNYVPSYDGNNNLVHYVGTDSAAWEAKRLISAHMSARFAAEVTLSGSGSVNVHRLQVDAVRTFTLAGGNLTFNRIDLMPHASTPAKIAVTGNVNFNSLAGATATIANGAGSGSSGLIDLGGGTRTFNVANGAAAVDLAVNVPVTNGGLIKAGAGTMALNAANTYTGNTSVQTGKLSLASPFLSDTADVLLSTGAILDLGFSGNDVINNLFFDGVAQAPGIWGAVGSGAQFTSSLLNGIGRLQVDPFVPPPPPSPGPGDLIDHFEIDESHFGWAYNFSPSSQTFGLAANTTIDRVVGEHQGPGQASQLLNLVTTEEVPSDPTWQIRHNSGIGSAAQPAGNVPLDATGYVGFWLKTDDAGITVQIAIDDPTAAGPTALEKGDPLSVIADNQWHLYQWNFEDDDDWLPFNAGSNGAIDAVNGTITIDSIWFAGSGNAQIYLDNVSHNPEDQLAALVPGDYDRNGVVEAADYNAWQASMGLSVPPGTSADGNGDGVVDLGDYVVWRKQMSSGGGGSTSLSDTMAGVPEPSGLLLLAAAAIGLLGFRSRQ